jgi:hypothetical protein
MLFRLPIFNRLHRWYLAQAKEVPKKGPFRPFRHRFLSPELAASPSPKHAAPAG